MHIDELMSPKSDYYKDRTASIDNTMLENLKHNDKRCCGCLSLQKGVQIIVIGDIAFLIIFVLLYAFSLYE
jgi:hypothetical protein